MAKETVFSYKIKVEGQEVEQTVNSLDGFQTRLSELRKQLNSAPLNSQQFADLSKEIKRTEGAFDAAKSKNQGFLDQLSGLPGIFGQVGQSVQGAGKFFGNFNMILKASPIGLLVAIAAKVIAKLSEMEGVLDPLNKITAIFSGVMGKLANVVLPPIAAILEGIAIGAAKVANFFGSLMGGAEDSGDALAYVADTYDQLEDSQAAYELAQQKSNRALAEARELAADDTKSFAERRQAVMDAEKLERDIAKQGRERALAKARAQAIELATELGLSRDKIEALKTANATEVENFANSVSQLKGLNREKLNALYGGLGEIEQISADEAKIGKKTQAQLDSLKQAEAAAAKAAAAEATQRAKERRQEQIANLDAEIKLLTSFRENNEVKDAAYYKRIEQQLRDYYKRKNELEDKDRKLSKAQLEQRRIDQEKAIRGGIQTLMDGDDKLRKLNEDLRTSEEAVANARKATITDQLVLLENQQTQLDINYQRDLQRLTKDVENKKALYGQDSEEYKQALIAKNNAEATYLTKTAENDKKKEELVKARNERLKNLDEVYRKEEEDGLKDGLEKQLNIIKDGEKKKLEEYKKGLMEAVKAGDLTLMEALVKYARYAKLVGDKTKEASKAAIGSDFVKNILEGVDTAISGATSSFFSVYRQIGDARIQLEEGFKKGTIDLQKYQEGVLALDTRLTEQKKALATALDAVAKGAMAAAQGFGEETKAGKILIKVSQAASLANTALALSEAIAGLGKDLKKGFPTNIVAVASTLALIGTAFGQARALFKKQEKSDAGEYSEKLASGGMVFGSGTSTSDSIPAMLSNGESVINARSTSMFRPMLSAINQAGGGKGFEFGGVVSSQDLAMRDQNGALIEALTTGQQSQPIKTYVVASDMTSTQQFDRVQKMRSTL